MKKQLMEKDNGITHKKLDQRLLWKTLAQRKVKYWLQTWNQELNVAI
jgi:hypothetical protein